MHTLAVLTKYFFVWRVHGVACELYKGPFWCQLAKSTAGKSGLGEKRFNSSFVVDLLGQLAKQKRARSCQTSLGGLARVFLLLLNRSKNEVWGTSSSKDEAQSVEVSAEKRRDNFFA